MGSVQVDILGPIRVRVDDREIDLGGARNRALIARLALDARRPVGRATLIDDLWGLDVPADAANALQSIVSRTRRRLPSETLRLTPAGYVLEARCDAIEFERLAAERHTNAALALWRGTALAGIEAPFVDAAAARLATLRLSVLETHLGAIVHDGADAAIVAELAELTAAHPYRENLWFLYLRALVSIGQPAEALAAYESMRSRLADDLGVDPSAELQELHVTILRGSSAAHHRHCPQLPTGVTSFVGRDEAIADVGAALIDYRLVTILGPGGAGKTRLSIETARAHARQFDDVWLVELAPVTGGGDIGTAILAAMGQLEVSVGERGTVVANRPDTKAKLFEALRESQGLIILDNCEHLIDEVATIAAELLANAGRLKVLATSREPLRILGEFGYQLSPLAQPPADCTPEQALTYSAVELFMQRAGAVDQSFELDPDSLPAVLEICARLDGQPLAIELATARLRTLSVHQVADRLSDRFRLLTGGSRTSLPRHRTLRAVVEWSWDLLSQEERQLAERIAVFPGGVSVESASAVFGADVADVLDSLADKSLLVPVRGSTLRFRMLETLREYGIERLIDQGIVQDVRSAHLDYFLDYVERWEPVLRGHDQLEGFTALDVERGNINAALRFAVDQQDGPRAKRMTGALAWFWSTRGQHIEAAGWGKVVIELPCQADPVADILATALAITVLFAETENEPSRLDELITRILGIVDSQQPDHPLVDLILSAIHMFEKGDGRTPPEPDDVWTVAMINVMQNLVMENAGRFDVAVPVLDDAIKGFTETGDRWGLATAISQRGNLEAARGDFEQARESWSEAIDLLREMGSEDDVFQLNLRQTAIQIAMIEGDDVAVFRDDLTKQLEMSRKNGSSMSEIQAIMGLAGVEHIVGDDRAAVELLQGLLITIGDMTAFGGDHMLSSVFADLAVAQAGLGEMAAAGATIRAAREAGLATKDMPLIANVAVASAYVAASAGEPERAARQLGAADRIRGQVDQMNRDAKTLAEKLRESLSDEIFDARFAEGFDLDQAAAVRLVTAVG